MNAKEKIVFTCEACGDIYYEKEHADNCCAEKHPQLCVECGSEIHLYYWARGETLCRNCKRKHFEEERSAKEKAAYEKATKINYKDYKVDMVCDGNSVIDLDAALERYNDDPQGILPWAWGCKEVKCEVTEGYVRDMLESVIDGAELEDPPEIGERFNIKSLMALIEKWSKKNNFTYFVEDRSVVVLLKDAVEGGAE